MSVEFEDFENLMIRRISEALCVPAEFLRAPPTRADTIKEAWRLYGDRFDYKLGHLTFEHDLDIIEPIRFEAIRYGNFMVVEAEGVVVSKLPIITIRKVD